MSYSVRLHRQQPTRLPRPWDSPGKNTGVGCHFLLQCMKVKSESEVAQSCPTLSDPMDCSLPGSSIHGIFQARVLEWGAIAFSDIHTSKCKAHSHENLLEGARSSTLCSLSLSSVQQQHLPWRLTSNCPLVELLDTYNNSKCECLCCCCLLVLVTHSCLTLCDPMDCSLPGSPVHGILQVRIMKWVAMPSSKRSSRPWDRTCISCISGRFFTN